VPSLLPFPLFAMLRDRSIFLLLAALLCLSLLSVSVDADATPAAAAAVPAADPLLSQPTAAEEHRQLSSHALDKRRRRRRPRRLVPVSLSVRVAATPVAADPSGPPASLFVRHAFERLEILRKERAASIAAGIETPGDILQDLESLRDEFHDAVTASPAQRRERVRELRNRTARQLGDNHLIGLPDAALIAAGEAHPVAGNNEL